MVRAATAMNSVALRETFLRPVAADPDGGYSEIRVQESSRPLAICSALFAVITGSRPTPSANKKRLAVSSYDGTTTLWSTEDLTHPRQISRFSNHTRGVRTEAFDRKATC